MIIRIFSSIVLTVLSAAAFAEPRNSKTCQGAACFYQFNFYQSETSVQDSNSALRSATKVAWRPGYNRQRTESRSSGNSSWGNSWFSSVPRTGPANSKGTIVFNPRESTFAAYDSRGDLVKSGRASGGMSWCDDVARSCRTPVGTFRVYRKGSEECVSNKYPLEEGGGAPMPHCMYFNGGYAIHGSNYVPSRPASHGCVRVHPATAEWLHRNFVRVGTVVKVQSY